MNSDNHQVLTRLYRIGNRSCVLVSIHQLRCGNAWICITIVVSKALADDVIIVGHRITVGNKINFSP